MEQMIAMCGLDCLQCPALIATRNNDDAMRVNVAEEWSKMFNASISPSSINCDGCMSGSTRLFHHCSECEIRLCGLEKKVSTCAACESYPCEPLNKFFAMVPTARETLDAIRNR